MLILNLSPKRVGLMLGIIVLLAAVLLWLAPDEQTLGSGIKSVYVHVAFTWTGMVGLAVAGFLGLGAAVLDRRELQLWATTVSWIALALFASGFLLSAVAANVNWGAVFWQEPRAASALQVLAVGLIVQVLSSWSIPTRLKGVLHFLMALFLAWSVLSTPLVLHPENAARSSSSLAIRLTFLGLFLLCTAAATLIAVHMRRITVNSRR